MHDSLGKTEHPSDLRELESRKSDCLTETIDATLQRSHHRIHKDVHVYLFLKKSIETNGIHVELEWGGTNHRARIRIGRRMIFSPTSEIDPFLSMISSGKKSPLDAGDISMLVGFGLIFQSFLTVFKCSCCLSFPALSSLRHFTLSIEKISQNSWVQVVFLHQSDKHEAQALGIVGFSPLFCPFLSSVAGSRICDCWSGILTFVFIFHEARCAIFSTSSEASMLCSFLLQNLVPCGIKTHKQSLA